MIFCDCVLLLRSGSTPSWLWAKHGVFCWDKKTSLVQVPCVMFPYRDCQVIGRIMGMESGIPNTKT